MKRLKIHIFLLAIYFSVGSLSLMAETEKETAILAGGCFWCLEGPFDAQQGVLETYVGYTGGSKETANYDAVSMGDSGHYEAVKIIYDPQTISYSQILDIFWRQIDPTQANGQFADIGPQYKTAIFYLNEQQKKIATESVKNLEKSSKFSKPIVTEIKPASEFYLAEEYHQEYYRKAPEHYQRYKYGSGRAGFIEKNWK